MNATFTKLNEVSGELTVTIDQADYADKVKSTLKKISKNHPEPGFRPGHTPMSLLEKKYGKSVKYDVINETVGEAVFNYIKENNLRVLGNPLPVADNNINFDQADFTFKFRVALAPELKPAVNKDMHIPYYTIEVSEEMIQRQSDALRRRFGEQVKGDEIEPTAVVKGTITELNEGGSVKEGGIVQENGIVAPEHFVSDEQKALFIGHKVGDEIVFNPAATCDGNEIEIASMLNIDKDQVAEHKGNFRFDVKEIIVLRLAELDQKFYDEVFGKDKVHNDEEYKNALREMIAGQLRNDSNFRFTIDAKEVIMKSVGDIDLPEDILVDYLRSQHDEYTDEQARQEFDGMRQQLCWELVRDAIAEELNVKVEESDLHTVARSMAQNQFAQYGIANVPEEALNKYAEDILKDKNARQQVASQAADMRIFAAIKDAVSVDDKTVNVEGFNALFKPAE